MNHISSKKITNFFIKKLTQIGVEPIVAEATSNALVEASLFGIDSHGVNLFQHYCEAVNGGRISKNKDINFNRNGAIIICDAKNVFAHYAALELLSEMHEVSKEYGVSIGTIRSSDHIGAVGIHSINSKIKNIRIIVRHKVRIRNFK